MFKCYLTDKKTWVDKHLSETPIEVHDDSEFIITLELTGYDITVHPVVMVGDIEIKVNLESGLSGNTAVYKSVDGKFFDNAFFLNYFGECEVSVLIGDIRKTFIIEVNVTGHKANIAKEMLIFLSDNADDILQTCFSKSQTGFSQKHGDERNLIKISALTQTVELIESLFHSFKLDNKNSIEHRLQYHSNKPIIVDDSSASWLSENMDELEVADSSNYKLKIKKRYYQVNIPNSVTYLNTDLKENRVLHQFVLVALEYLSVISTKLEKQTQHVTDDVEYNEYVKFDHVIKGMINPILTMRIKAINDLIRRVKRIHLFFKANIPVKKTTGEMPIQTQYTLRHRHYALTFNQIANFYNASDADRSNSEFLLGLRNLSQLFELCCLYYLVRYFKKISEQVSTSWVNHKFEWSGHKTKKINVLANEFIFESDFYEYSLIYEKKYFSFSKNTMDLQEGNLVRIDQRNNYREPDYTIKVLNKVTQDYYFIILDAKFSRSYKMENNKPDKVPSVLQTVFNKYATNLKTYRNGVLIDATRYVGVLFGLSKNDREQKRISMFSNLHDVDGLAPIFPFAAADFISFSGDSDNLDDMLDKYILR